MLDPDSRYHKTCVRGPIERCSRSLTTTVTTTTYSCLLAVVATPLLHDHCYNDFRREKIAAIYFQSPSGVDVLLLICKVVHRTTVVALVAEQLSIKLS